MTDAERLLWRHLRNSQLDGLKFRRQEPIDPYVVDFICFEKKIIIELDGGQHGEDIQIKKDNERTKYLNEKGFQVVRFPNREVLKNIVG
ncbi:MAG TPA: endonuclease domain-containing protein, partial [Candidatus Kapabacteria bacterium]|nr:endonuclease domain-containing protein [Candidatus Kapabacteria bacterium]